MRIALVVRGHVHRQNNAYKNGGTDVRSSKCRENHKLTIPPHDLYVVTRPSPLNNYLSTLGARQILYVGEGEHCLAQSTLLQLHNYDLVINTRPDVLFKLHFDKWNIDRTRVSLPFRDLPTNDMGSDVITGYLISYGIPQVVIYAFLCWYSYVTLRTILGGSSDPSPARPAVVRRQPTTRRRL